MILLSLVGVIVLYFLVYQILLKTNLNNHQSDGGDKESMENNEKNSCRMDGSERG
ncbi:threonine/homoserine/homoserine lactone efflux protein [Fontibacillus solani]|uniref:Threonine/homoserine/homoserine lactone efflux protein n=1 Tax=Fontibacillus solani TaxID=1572857 RepID=A0A7W3XQA4_9BACL|nr:threonine/homoserine/homoserine lactone efflux protein [Fontibacillus solani]